MSLINFRNARSDSATEDILRSIFIGIALTVLSYGVGAAFGWVALSSINWLEVFAVFTSYGSTWLCVVERRFNYVFGIISTMAYCLLFWQFGLVASSVLNGYLALSLVYGAWRWRKDVNTRPVTRVAKGWWPIYVAVTAVAWLVAIGLILMFGGTVVPTDALILVFTILAQFLLDNKKLETWPVWILVNVFAIYTYATAGLALAAFQYVFFLVNAFYGFYQWKRSMNSNEEPVEATAPAMAAA